MKDFIVSEFKSKYDKKTFVISAATWEWITELIDFLIDNYSKEVSPDFNKDEIKEIKIYDLKWNVNPKAVIVEYLWDYKFKASGERLEQIVRMTDFDNREALLRIYDVLDKMWVMRIIEPQLKKLLETSWKDNSFFFEWNDEEWVNPKVIIAWREIALDKLKYNL
jgi:hypothetical protein